jgi:hypothetical protein
MKAWMATAAALALLSGISAASAQSAPAAGNDKAEKPMMAPSSAPKANVPAHKARVHHAMRTRHNSLRETTGAGGRVGTIGGGRNDPSIHQSAGDRDSRGYPKQH